VSLTRRKFIKGLKIVAGTFAVVWFLSLVWLVFQNPNKASLGLLIYITIGLIISMLLGLCVKRRQLSYQWGIIIGIPIIGAIASVYGLYLGFSFLQIGINLLYVLLVGVALLILMSIVDLIGKHIKWK